DQAGKDDQAESCEHDVGHVSCRCYRHRCVTRIGPATLRLEMRVVFAVIVLGLCLCACGAAGIGASAPSPSPSTGPGVGYDVTVSEKTRTATMRGGQKLEAVLHANPGMTNWSNLRSSEPSVLAPIVNPAATAAR